jgi:hypothetical protein
MFEIMPEMGTERTVPVAPEFAEAAERKKGEKLPETDRTTDIDNTVVDMPKAAE